MEFDQDFKLSPQTGRLGYFRRGYLEYHIATLPGVQAAIDDYTFQIAVKAEEDLAQHKAKWQAKGDDPTVPVDELVSGRSRIDIEDSPSGVDRFVVLNDEAGQNAAMSIEYGHGSYKVVRPDGTSYVVKESQPTWILHNASNLPKKARARVKSRIVYQKKRRKKR